MLPANASAEAPGPLDIGGPATTLPNDPLPLAIKQRGWAWWVGVAITLAVLGAVLIELRNVDFSDVRGMLPTSPLFWLVFATSYFVAPAADWVIFRKLWQIPASGFLALLRKLIGNELLLGYIGEVYFYTWARRRTEMTSSPFGAIKDVAILSALMGNAVTLVLLVLAYPLLGTLRFGIDASTLLASVAVVLGMSSAVLFFRKKLFSLPRSELLYVSGLHLVRILAVAGLNAWAWHLVLPEVGLQWWLLLSSCRQLLSRLPFMPNKDVVFAGLAVFMIGHDAEIGALMTMMASLILGLHLALGLLLTVVEAAGWKRA